MKTDKQKPSPLSDKTQSNLTDLLEDAIAALELCLESEGLSWEAEQAAEVVVNKFEKSSFAKAT